MRCSRYREAASAALDGEPSPDPATLADHRASCAHCAAWSEDVESITRRVRVRPAEGAPPDLGGTVTAGLVLPDRALRRRVTVLRWLLAAVGVVQVATAVPALFDDDLGMAMSQHASHESAAWNLAVAAALLLVAWRPARVGGALTAVGTFVLVLTGLSVVDVVLGRVGVERLATHAAVLVGCLVLVLVQRAIRGLPEQSPADPVVAGTEDSAALRRWSERVHRSRRDAA